MRAEPVPTTTAERLAWSIPQLAECTSLHPNSLYRWAKAGKINVIKAGDRVLVPAAEVARLMREGTRK